MNRVKIKGVYKHFKGDYYILEEIAKDCETLEDIVIYRGLYEDNPVWVRPLNDFISEIDHEKYPNVKQTYKYELQEIESVRSKFKN